MFRPTRKTQSLNRIEALLQQIADALTPVDTSGLDAVTQEGHRVSEKFQGLTHEKEK